MVLKALYSPHCIPFFLPIIFQVAAAIAIIIVVIVIAITILQMGTLKSREVGQFAQGHVGRKWWNPQFFLPTHQTIRDNPVNTVHCWYWVNLSRNGGQATQWICGWDQRCKQRASCHL